MSSIKFKVLLFSLFLLLLFVPPLEAKWDVDVASSLYTAYDSNVTYANNNAQDDVVATVLLGLSLGNEWRTQRLNGSLNLIQQSYFDHNQFNNFAQEMKLNYYKDLSRFDRFRVWNHFTYAEAPLTYQESFSRSTGRYQYCKHRFGVDYEKDLSPHYVLRSKYSNELYAVEREDLSDSFMQRLDLELDYIRSSDSRFVCGYNFVTRKYDPGDRSFVHNLIFGYRRKFNVHVSMDARVGVAFIDSFGSDLRVRRTSSLSFVNELDETTRWNVSLDQDSNPSASSVSTLDSWRFNAQFAKQLSQRISVSVSTFYAMGHYDEIDIDEDFFGARLQLDFAVRTDLKAVLSYVFSEKITDATLSEYTKNLFTLGLTYVF